ncbi:MAG: hypothetical protein AVDCRST_MAG80-1967 [uncultured Rubrobacteraceae bacterium]|uniref:Uncharacterized protein n=1 Tax=uncultured Rubrobacteraceae bacterium TaxID=349277 RepID=A0A6J4QR33_9ACTN|nr:MAG: hypothetical protein AVDCRST_MAG80-1967 [uncultured Rubrobacteraceae bacterium]
MLYPSLGPRRYPHVAKLSHLGDLHNIKRAGACRLPHAVAATGGQLRFYETSLFL